MKEVPATVFARLIDGGGRTPLLRQIYDGLRDAILGGQLEPGRRLASSRSLASQLGVARNTVVAAYEQLLAEGYLEGLTGSGTFVARDLPDERSSPPPSRRHAPSRPSPLRLSRRGAALAGTTPSCPSRVAARPFRPGYPGLDAFPWTLWQRLWQRRWRSCDADLLGYGDPAGHGPLREAIAAHVAVSRAIRCAAEQVIVVNATHQAVSLLAHALLDAGDAAWVEDPGFVSARLALADAGVRVVPVPVDAEGMDVEAGLRGDARARLCYVTPSHQYPLGVTLSLARRLALLEWARTADAWVIEDDYDSEFRYAGRPLAALAGLDPDGRVIYLGTFSKTLFPALRLSYLIVPPSLAQAFRSVRNSLDQYAPVVTQAVVADFLSEGHYARHLRRMRTLYAERQEVLLSATRGECGSRLEVKANPAGLHALGWLAEGVDDRDVSRRAAAVGVEAASLSAYRVVKGGRGGLVLGFAAYEPRALRLAVRRLDSVLDRPRATSGR